MVSLCCTAVILSYIFNSTLVVKYKHDISILQGSLGMWDTMEVFLSLTILTIWRWNVLLLQ